MLLSKIWSIIMDRFFLGFVFLCIVVFAAILLVVVRWMVSPPKENRRSREKRLRAEAERKKKENEEINLLYSEYSQQMDALGMGEKPLLFKSPNHRADSCNWNAAIKCHGLSVTRESESCMAGIGKFCFILFPIWLFAYFRDYWETAGVIVGIIFFSICLILIIAGRLSIVRQVNVLKEKSKAAYGTLLLLQKGFLYKNMQGRVITDFYANTTYSTEGSFSLELHSKKYGTIYFRYGEAIRKSYYERRNDSDDIISNSQYKDLASDAKKIYGEKVWYTNGELVELYRELGNRGCKSC